MSLRLRFLNGVDPRLKSEVVSFGRWLRRTYEFSVPLEIRLRNVPSLDDFDGTSCALRWWQSSVGHERVTGEIAVGNFVSTLKDQGEQWAFPTVIAAVARVVKYYDQAVSGAPSREDYATRWGDRVLEAYVDEAPPPPLSRRT